MSTPYAMLSSRGQVFFEFTSVFCESDITQSCLTLCDPMDCSLPGSVHEIFQARVLEWAAISFSNQSALQSACLIVTI